MGRFYELFAGRVYRFVRRMLGEDHLAEDVTQDIFMHMQKSLPAYDPARELSPWVFTIASNKVRDFWRSKRHSDLQHEQNLDPAARGQQRPLDGGARGVIPAHPVEDDRGHGAPPEMACWNVTTRRAASSSYGEPS